MRWTGLLLRDWAVTQSLDTLLNKNFLLVFIESKSAMLKVIPICGLTLEIDFEQWQGFQEHERKDINGLLILEFIFIHASVISSSSGGPAA